MFSSSTLHSTDPVTGNVYFEGLTFSCDDADTDAFVVSEKYCRVVFSRCRYEQIRSNESSIFMQSWRWVNCAVWRWKGAFSKTVKEAYDCHANLVRFEGASVGGDAWSWSSIQGCSVMQGLHEGSFGSHITADGTNGLMVGGNYTENYSNPSPHYQFANPGVGGVAKGVAFAGNHVNVLTEGTSDLSYYPVRLGDCSGSGTGNTSNANLYDDTNVTPGNFTSSGDKAAVSLHKGTLPLAGLPTGVRTLSTGIVAHAGGGQGSATLLTAQTNIISTVASADDSVILPAFSGPFSMDLRVRNSGANTVKVFPPVGYNFAGLGTNAPDSLTGGGTDRTYFYIGAGVWTA
jgi:hypothetical protein